MANPPPPYDEVVREHPPALVVRLQVWHYNISGRSNVYNDGLAQTFLDNDTELWKVVPLEVEGVTGPGSHDQFVPVEVQFRHSRWAYDDPGEHPMAAVRRLFYQIAPQFIYQFFVSIRSAPTDLNIYPLNIPPAFTLRYTHIFKVLPLTLRTKVLYVPDPVGTDDVQSWLHSVVEGAGNGLTILSRLVTLFTIYDEIQRGDFDRSIPINLEAGDVPEHLGRLQALFVQIAQDIAVPAAAQGGAAAGDGAAARQAAFNSVAEPLHQYNRLGNRINTKLAILEAGQELSDQDMHELVHDAFNARLRGSMVTQEFGPVIRLLLDNYEPQCKSYKESRNKSCGASAVVVGLAVLFAWNPAMWVVAGSALAGGAAGGLANACLHEHAGALTKKENVDQLRIALKTVIKDLREAQETIAMLYLAQVMKLDISANLPNHFKRTVLGNLGVDIDQAPNANYRRELIPDRFRRLREATNALHSAIRQVMSDANFEPREVVDP